LTPDAKIGAALAKLVLADRAAARAAGYATAPPVAPAISASLQQFVDRGDLAGAVAPVAQHGKLVHLDADVETQRPTRPDTLFSIVSMSKPVADVEALICCDDGKLSLDKPLDHWLPEFDQPPNNTITLRHVLTHTSGLFSDQRNTGTLAETVARLAKQKLPFEPGSRWLYTGQRLGAGGAGATSPGQLTETSFE
jgi:CubicO group peptidase (beta-lactamase class C family)